MKGLRCCGFVLVGLVLASSSASLQVLKGSRVPLNVKLGLWEITAVTQMSGTPPMDTSTMTPEQRTRMAAAMEAVKQRAATPHTYRTCLTKEKLDKELFENKESCKSTVLESSSKVYAVKFECGGAHPSTGEWHFVALTPETVKGNGTFTMEPNKMVSTSTATGKWVAASCGNVK